MTTTVVFSGGPTGEDTVDAALSGVVPDTVVAADGGLRSCRDAGLVPDLVVGDMDSADPADLRLAEQQGAGIERHPEAKEATDLELAIEAALRTGPTRLVVVGSGGGRLDHLVAWVALVGSPRWAATEIDAWMGPTLVQPVHPGSPRTITGRPGDTLTLVALHGAVTGLDLSGTRWPLAGASLEPGSTLGVSNRLVAERAQVSCAHGVVTVLRPAPEVLTRPEAEVRSDPQARPDLPDT